MHTDYWDGSSGICACSQDAAAGLGERYLGMELHARLLHLARKLRKVPEDIEDPVLHSAAIRSKKPPKGVCVAKDQSAAAKPWISKQSVSRLLMIPCWKRVALSISNY